MIERNVSLPISDPCVQQSTTVGEYSLLYFAFPSRFLLVLNSPTQRQAFFWLVPALDSLRQTYFLRRAGGVWPAERPRSPA